MASINNVSLNYRSSAEAVTLSCYVEIEGAVVKLKKGVSWINNIRLSGNKILFNVEENTTTTSGPDFVTQKCPFRNWLINNILYLCIPLFWGTQKVF